MKLSDLRNPDDAWIVHREEVETLESGVCDVYVVLDAISGYSDKKSALISVCCNWRCRRNFLKL